MLAPDGPFEWARIDQTPVEIKFAVRPTSGRSIENKDNDSRF
jgi:hypothetical protein